ncbi:FAD-dependent oxidoreductase [Echinicola vietnamensis]|uniref:Kynurenine 3-monooxygenase n=1 Tax=Echinicola vietnamensis (strain DSM 17526 / LMG 23754 / KMM 6221) TaxID=926556 RepID=L0FY82_ECHVK|nr:NAD(P)/FAD-dependent oxidoreductase [Echinicola vietnamensis]AGA77716.1 2-polyprenyl-6-methoxyphenol hydroxylase-like oxidoreductase [Echinicola vietnamensis DSM 17526]
MKKNDVSIIGAGLIGSLLGIYLQKRGLDVSIYEKRPDLRDKKYAPAGRSINMALSDRGWKALDKIGLREMVAPYVIPMYGRRVHDEHGETSFLPYGKENQAIYSISRGKFNHMLVDEAERYGAKMNFNHSCEEISIADTAIKVVLPDGTQEYRETDVIIGADGAYSSLRDAMQRQTRLNYKQEYISHGYKELTIPPTAEGEFAMDPNALHIWPRGQFMLIALPNPDKSFTCTLFLPFEGGKVCFDKINDEEDLESVFKTYFADAFALMPDLNKEYFGNPTSSLINVECFPWLANKSMLIGDACHAMVPFFGQGMNCGFEDCFILDGLIEKYGTTSWELVFEKFQKVRKPDTDAISEMARNNFTEMRDSVANPRFLVRKKIEAKLHELYPTEWIPLYTMVTFSDMKYADAYAQGKLQDEVMDKVMEDPMIMQNWQQVDYGAIISQIETARMV